MGIMIAYKEGGEEQRGTSDCVYALGQGAWGVGEDERVVCGSSPISISGSARGDVRGQGDRCDPAAADLRRTRARTRTDTSPRPMYLMSGEGLLCNEHVVRERERDGDGCDGRRVRLGFGSEGSHGSGRWSRYVQVCLRVPSDRDLEAVERSISRPRPCRAP